ncbi:hypothetical protein FSARC_10690 [Fusarium sarcochroum]|uniref:Methyltransferase type 11 domain-containing protein n=1 Tax=Fusarium sarcochroum TaxID=1208366 RepID=A0A8H4TKV9_9HYPO|nr:hypothetical protein FSARC_10690 [Fusarium sarcochroum]
MAFFTTIKELFGSLIGPYLFMSIPLRFLPSTTLEVLRTADLRIILSPSAFKDIWFSNFWPFVGPQIKTGAEPLVISLLEGRVQNGKPGDDVTSEPIGGICLEIGAGTGLWADMFAKVNTGASRQGDGEVRHRKGGDGVTRVYGIEPNPKSAAALQKRVKEVGLDGIYEVIPTGIESLDDRFEPESVDCIVTILCLCSIPEPEKNIKLLYNSLKKGGRWDYWAGMVTGHGSMSVMSTYKQIIEGSWAMGEI